jgi:hypothetical protein
MDNGSSSDEETPLVVLAETESYAILVSEEEGEHVFNIELGNVTLHLYQDEWEELVELVNAAQKP